jgi:hypothetical protein
MIDSFEDELPPPLAAALTELMAWSRMQLLRRSAR